MVFTNNYTASNRKPIQPQLSLKGLGRWLCVCCIVFSSLVIQVVNLPLVSLAPTASAAGTASANLVVSRIYSGDTTLKNISLVVTTSKKISEIQGASRTSPLVGQAVATNGVVIGLKSNGFFMQDPSGAGAMSNPPASDGIFVYTGSAPTVTLGHSVQVTGTVSEFKSNSTYQPLTEIGGKPTISDLGVGPSVTPTVISTDPNRLASAFLRKPPTSVIYDPNTPNYNPSINGLDFDESLESMLVEVDNARVVGPTNQYGEFAVVPDNGTGVTGVDARGALEVSATDFNPERILVGKDSLNYPGNPNLTVGDRLTTALTGPLDYQFGDYYVQPRVVPTVNTSQEVQVETTTPLNNTNQLRVVSYNIENFNRLGANAARVITVANQIKNNLQSPDILVILEVQDDSGATDDGTVTADQNLNAIANQISSLGGPTYTWAYVNPVNDQDGGQPGGNIRQVFFYRTDRGLTFVNKPSLNSTTPDAVNPDGSLLYSPGRIDPTNSYWNDSRKPLVGEFRFQNQRLIVIANHLIAKLGDTPLYGAQQPPNYSSESTRSQQALLVRNFVSSIQNADPNANVIVAGDLNDFEFSDPLRILKNGTNGTLGSSVAASQVLSDVVEDPRVAGEKYTYDYEGNAQVLDHILYSQGLASKLATVDIVHMNSDFYATSPNRETDHEAVTAVFNFAAVVTPTTYTYNLPFLANVYTPTNAPGSFTSFVALQNMGVITANISFQYYNASGSLVSTPSGTCTTVAQYGECITPNPFATGTKGAGILTSDQPLNVVVAEATPYGGSAYAVSAGASSSLVAPLAINNSYGGFITQLNIFNTGANAVTTTVSFYNADGSSAPVSSTKVLNIPAHATTTLDQTASDSGLAPGFYGWAMISGTTGSQLAAQVVEQNPNTHFAALANTQTTGQTRLNAPAIFNGAYGGFVTGANIVNPNSTPVSVTVTYYTNDGMPVTTAPFNLPAKAIAPVYQGSGSGGNGLPVAGLPSGFTGAAVVTATAGIVMVVNEAGGNTIHGTPQTGVYSALAGGGTTIGLPVAANGGLSYTTGATIFNSSSQSVTATIQYYTTSGASTGISQTFTVAPYASQGFFQGAVGLPAGFYGTAVISEVAGSASSPNALIATTNATSPDFFYTYTEPS